MKLVRLTNIKAFSLFLGLILTSQAMAGMYPGPIMGPVGGCTNGQIVIFSGTGGNIAKCVDGNVIEGNVTISERLTVEGGILLPNNTNGTTFSLYAGGETFNGVYDSFLRWGYNIDPTSGTRIDPAEEVIYFTLEQDYYSGGVHYWEFNLDWANFNSTKSGRPMGYWYNKDVDEGQWAFRANETVFMAEDGNTSNEVIIQPGRSDRGIFSTTTAAVPRGSLAHKNTSTNFNLASSGLMMFQNTDNTNGNHVAFDFQDSSDSPVARVGSIITNHTTHDGQLAFLTRKGGAFGIRALIDEDGNATFYKRVILSTKQVTPASSASTCTQGQIWWDDNFTYICTSANLVKRSGLATW